jgi:hypothetical protein
MAQAGTQAPTNEPIVRMLDAVRAELAESKRREEQIARDLARLLERNWRDAHSVERAAGSGTRRAGESRLMGRLGGRVGGRQTPGPRRAEAR